MNGGASVNWRFDRRAIAAAIVHQAAAGAVADVAEAFLEDANRSVPIEVHDLEASGDVQPEGLYAVVFYDTPYARRQHEELTWQHDAGRRAKWLELTLTEWAGGQFNRALAVRMQARIP